MGGTEKAQDVAGDVADSAKSQQPVGYVASARNTVGNVVDKVLGTAERRARLFFWLFELLRRKLIFEPSFFFLISIIATAAHKIDSATPGGTSSDSTIQGSLNSAAQGTKDAFKADAQTGQSAFAVRFLPLLSRIFRACADIVE